MIEMHFPKDALIEIIILWLHKFKRIFRGGVIMMIKSLRCEISSPHKISIIKQP